MIFFALMTLHRIHLPCSWSLRILGFTHRKNTGRQHPYESWLSPWVHIWPGIDCAPPPDFEPSVHHFIKVCECVVKPRLLYVCAGPLNGFWPTAFVTFTRADWIKKRRRQFGFSLRIMTSSSSSTPVIKPVSLFLSHESLLFCASVE